MPDDIFVEILEDGTISIKTSDISETNHLSADQLIEEIEELIGGKRVEKPLKHRFWKNKKVLRGGKIVKAH